MEIKSIDNFVNKIILGNCLDILPSIPDNSIDFVFTDPPYGISSEVVISRGRNQMIFQRKDILLDFDKWDKFNSFSDYWNFTKNWLDSIVRILKPGRIFASWFDRDKINFISCYLQKKYGFKSKGYFAQIKKNPVPQARKVKWSTGWECIGLWQKPGGKLVYNYKLGQQADYIFVPIVSGKERIKLEDGKTHPTQKPIKIAELFIKYWTNEGDIVLDPFCGVGTIPLAAFKNNRRFIGIEIDERYYKKTIERIELNNKQILLLKN